MKPASLKVAQRNASGVRERLEEALEQDFDAVLVVGFKGGDVIAGYSDHVSRAKILGALEELKFRLLNDCYNR